MAQKGRGIFMVYVDIDAQHVQEFNKWYNEEHLPELLSVPGILSAARYEAVKGGPQYLACYELESVAVMQTPAFTNRPRTPWGQKVRDWEEFDTHCRGTDLPGRHRNAGAWHGAGVADWPHVRPRRGRCGVERLVQWGICARLPQSAGSDLRPPLSGSRGY